ncbi:hypothetical protein [Tabrizicola soli]|jgi:hypothetical protein|uniref:Uncharacterized protein n=1 Tax=Tabrizicola soli TaxID=2185115 RepID=A0ABV7DUM4_9RHOB|nr:hypothetical protein [Tabrizicola soli]
MNNEAEKRIAAKLAKTMAMLCVRNTHLETLHAGKTPETKAGDWSDVTVVDAYGQHIAWTDVSRISDKEMHDLMRDIVNRLYTFHLCADEPGLKAEIEKWMAVSGRWDEPEIDTMMLNQKGGAV